MTGEAAETQDVEAKRDEQFAPVIAASAQDPIAHEAPLTGGREMAPQTLESIESALANGAVTEMKSPRGRASFESLTAER